MKRRAAEMIVAGTLFLLPQVYWSGVYDFVRWPRLLLLQVTTLLLLFVWLWRGDATSNSSLRRAILLLLGWQALTVLWAPNPVEGIQRFSQAATIGLFALACAHTLDRTALRTAIICLATTVTIVCGIAILQYWGARITDAIPTAGNPAATFGYRNYLATYLVVAIPIIVSAAWVEDNSRIRHFFSVSASAALLALIYTRTRGAWVGLIVVCAVWCVGSFLRGNPLVYLRGLSPRQWGITALTAVVLVAASLSSPAPDQKGQFGFDEHKSDALTTLQSTFSLGSTRGRTTLWANTLDMVLDTPLHGVGLGGWQFRYPEYDRGEWITGIVAPQRPHNDILWLLAETGFIGLGLYLWMLYCAARIALPSGGRKADPLTVGLALGVLGYVVHSLFSYPLERVASTSLAWFAIGAVAALHPGRSDAARSQLHVPAVAGALLILVAGTSVTGRRIAFDTHYAAAIEAWNRKDWWSVMGESRKALEKGPLDFRALQLLGAGSQKMGRVEEALAAFESSFRYHPNEGHVAYADLLAEVGRYTEAKRHYQREIELFPRRADARLGVINVSRATQDWDTVLEQSLAILSASPGHFEAVVAAADAHTNKKDDRAALAMLVNGLNTHPRHHLLYSRSGAIHERLGEFDRALEAHRRAAELDPKNPRHYNNVAAVHARVGRLELAVGAYEQALAIDPRYARAYRNLGDTFERLGRKTEAIRAYRSFVEHWTGASVHRQWAEERIQTLTESD